MKSLKKLLALLLLGTLVLSMCSMVAFAEDPTYTFVVKNNNASGYEYKLYQMFTGTVETVDGKQVFTNVEWGTGVKDETKEAMYNLANLQNGERTAAKFAAWMAEQDQAVFHRLMNTVGVNDGSTLQNPIAMTYGSYTVGGETVNGYGATNLPGGYYLVRNTAVPAGESFSDYIAIVLDADTAAEPKAAPAPTPSKKVTDKNDSQPNNPDVNATQDSADYDIGDSIPYTLSVQLPSNFSNYIIYKLAFKDEMSKGLTYNNDARIYFGAGDTTGTPINFDVTEGSAQFGADGKTYTYTIANLKTDDYAAYNLTNGDTIRITYTATLNENAVIGAAGNPNAFTVEYSNNPTATNEGNDTTTTTETDLTTVFTFKLVFDKVDGDGNALTGADFILYKWIEEENAWIDVTTLGTSSHPAKTVDDEGTVEDCIFTFSGLDDGRYKLHESVTPAGYNSIADIEFEVIASHDKTSANPQLTGLTGGNSAISFTMQGDTSNGSLSASIVNESGAVLPTTGGTGTLLLVLAGTIIALGGVVVLVTRRRMLAE